MTTRLISSTRGIVLKFVVLSAAIIMLGIGSFFGYNTYQSYLADKIYTPNEQVGFPDFTVKVTKADFKTVNLPLDEKSIAKYGSLSKQEDCATFSKEATWDMIVVKWYQSGPSEYNVCIRRNNSRNAINKYVSENKQLVVDFKIVASHNMSARDLKVELVPDSGRDLSVQVDTLNANQFFSGGAQYIDPFSSALNAPGPVMTAELYREPYKPYHKSDLGGDINKQIERNGFIYADIRNSENNVDLKINYHGQTRIVRITK